MNVAHSITHYMSRDISMNVVALMYLINETLIHGHAHYMSNMTVAFMSRHECEFREAHIMGNAMNAMNERGL